MTVTRLRDALKDGLRMAELNRLTNVDDQVSALQVALDRAGLKVVRASRRECEQMGVAYVGDDGTNTE